MNGEQHKQQRKLMMPAFHRKQVEGYCADMAAYTSTMLDQWRPGETFDMAEQIRELIMRVAVKTLFGLDLAQLVHSVGNSLRQLLNIGIFPLPSQCFLLTCQARRTGGCCTTPIDWSARLCG